jgi:acetylornithine deacetylase/succinyl-diaminopimelate desuccinylase-like protein
VPALAAEWSHPPFGAEIVDGQVWGRGALDMKAGVAMLVTAVVRTAGDERLPPGDVVLALTSDEETGSEFGAKFLVEDHAHEFNGVRHAISEFGGSTEWIGGRPFYPIQVAEKQACVLRATIRGAGGHPSTIVRRTASAKLGRLLTALDRERLPVHVTPVVREMLATLARALPLHHRLALRPLLTPMLTDRVLCLLGEDARSLDALLHNTATPVAIRAGDGSSIIPTEVIVDLDGRVVPGQTPLDLVRELEELVSGAAAFAVVREEPAAPSTPDMTLFPMLGGIIREREPRAVPFPLLLPGYTDARYFGRLGIQTYGFLPLKLPRAFPRGLIHAPDERVPVDAVRFGADCVREAIVRYRG